MSEAPQKAASKGWWDRHRTTIIAFACVIALDQFTKYLVRTFMEVNHSILTWSPIQLTYVMNTGASFGMLQGQTVFLIIAACIGIGVLFLYYRFYENPPLLVRIGLGMMIGGAMGNLIDRIRFGSVVDFFDARWWPVFNIADSSIDIGIALLIWVLLTTRETKSPATKTPTTLPPTDVNRDKPGTQARS